MNLLLNARAETLDNFPKGDRTREAAEQANVIAPAVRAVLTPYRFCLLPHSSS